MSRVITRIDARRIGEYVYASNRLIDVVGGSEIVRRATEETPARVLHESGGAVRASGGGNATLAFDSLDDARRFARLYTRALFDEAPGLDMVLAHREIDQDGTNGERDALQDLERAILRAKLEHASSVPLLGLPSTARCSQTDLPAVAVIDDTPASARVAAGRKLARGLDTRFEVNGHAFVEPRELDQLGRTPGERSLLGVVYVDGNGFGQWLAKGLDEDDPLDELSKRSMKIRRLLDDVVATVRQTTVAAIDAESDVPRLVGEPDRLSFELRRENSATVLPVRGIVSGGDDLVLVCDGRIAFSLAEAALAAVEESGWATACAGVAIVRIGEPFSRAVAAAIELAGQAKRARLSGRSDKSWLNWQFGLDSKVRLGGRGYPPVPLEGWNRIQELIRDIRDDRTGLSRSALRRLGSEIAAAWGRSPGGGPAQYTREHLAASLSELNASAARGTDGVVASLNVMDDADFGSLAAAVELIDRHLELSRQTDVLS